MNISLQDVRNLGYKKIHLNYCETVKQKRLFFSSMEKFNALFSSFKLPPYSFLNYWSEIKDLNDADIGGMKSLVLSVEPLISVNEPSNSVKRKFRNTWESVWDKYGEISGLSISELSVLKEVGLKIPIFLSSYELGNEKASQVTKDITLDNTMRNLLQTVCYFYNSVLYWYIQTQFESVFTVKDKSLYDIIESLCVLDNQKFSDLLERGDDLWE